MAGQPAQPRRPEPRDLWHHRIAITDDTVGPAREDPSRAGFGLAWATLRRSIRRRWFREFLHYQGPDLHPHLVSHDRGVAIVHTIVDARHLHLLHEVSDALPLA